jgi:hypothetical protein
MVGIVIKETKKEAQKKAKRHIAHMNQKKREKINPPCGRKLSHPQPL